MINAQVHIDTANGNKITIDTDKPEELSQTLADHAGIFGVGLEAREPVKLFREIFHDHGQFYDYIGMNVDDQGERANSDFTSFYFKDNLGDYYGQTADLHRLDLDDQEAQELVNVICERICDICEDTGQIEEGFTATATSQMRIEETGETRRLDHPTLMKDTMLVTDDGAFKVELKETEADGLQDIKDNIENGIHDTYEAQLEAEVKSRDRRINRLEDQLEEEKTRMFMEGLRMIDDLDDKWVVEDGKLVYQGKVHPTEVTHRYEEDFGTKVLTEEARERFFVENPAINITPTVTSIIVKGEAHHPHVDTGMCNGSFKEDLRDAPQAALEQLRQINLHNHDHTDAEREVKDNLEEWTVDAEEAENTGEVWE